MPKGVANDADKMDDAEVDDNARDAKPLAKDSSSDMGLSVRLAVGLSCGAGFAMTLAVGVTLLKRRNGTFALMNCTSSYQSKLYENHILELDVNK